MPKRPLARRAFEPKYFQALATQATSTKLTLRVACHGQSNLGLYPLVGPVGIPRTLSPAASANRFDGSSPLYSLYSMGMCRWTGYGF